AVGSGLAALGAVVWASQSNIASGQDGVWLLNSLVVVIVGGMGSIFGAAAGALLYGFVFDFSGSYLPTTGSDCCTQYSSILTFVLIALVLAFRPAASSDAREPGDLDAAAADRARARCACAPLRDPRAGRPRQHVLDAPDTALDVLLRARRSQPDLPLRIRRHGVALPDCARRHRRDRPRQPRHARRPRRHLEG